MSEMPTAPNPPTPPSGMSPAPRSRVYGLSIAALVVAAAFGLAWLMQANGATLPPPPVDGPPSPPADLPAHTGPARLSVTTNPVGAVVIVDDVIVGASPLQDIPLTPGSHAIRCEKEGFQPAIAQASTAQARPTLNLTLTPVAYAELEVKSEPTGAEVLVDGETRGRTPATVRKLTPGPHEIVIRKENFSTYKATQVLRAGERKILADVVLDNRLLAMLQELCNTEPRLISNHLDLAHYYYINNQMDAAAQEYARAVELSKLPMEVLPADATEAEREQVRLNYEWDKSRVRSELEKHTRKYKDYFGNTLDFDTFLKQYREYSGRTWDLSDADWVAGEADLQIAVGNPKRAVELFSDVLTREPASAAAACGLARATLMGNNTREGLPQLDQALKATPADPKDLKGDDRKYFGRTLRWLGAAELLAARQAAGAPRDQWRTAAGGHLDAALKIQDELGAKADLYEMASILRLRAHLLLQQGADTLPALQQALATAQKAAEKDTAKGHKERNDTLVEQLQLETAAAFERANQSEAARELFRQLAATGSEARPFKAQAQAKLPPVTGTRDTTTPPRDR